MTNDSQFIKTKQAVNDLFKQLDEQSLAVRDTLKEQLTEQFAKISEIVEQANAEVDKFTAERETIENEQLNERIAKLDAFCKTHKGTSFDILSPHSINVNIGGETYSLDARYDDTLDLRLKKIDDLLKICKQLDKANVKYKLKKDFPYSNQVNHIRLILTESSYVLDELDKVVFNFAIEKDDNVKLKAEYVSDSLEYIKRQIDPRTTFEVEVGTYDHDELYVTIKSTNQCKLEDVAIKIQQLAEHVSDNIDFQAK